MVVTREEPREGHAPGRSVLAKGEQAQGPSPAARGCAGLSPAAPSISRARMEPGTQLCCFHWARG